MKGLLEGTSRRDFSKGLLERTSRRDFLKGLFKRVEIFSKRRDLVSSSNASILIHNDRRWLAGAAEAARARWRRRRSAHRLKLGGCFRLIKDFGTQQQRGTHSTRRQKINRKSSPPSLPPRSHPPTPGQSPGSHVLCSPHIGIAWVAWPGWACCARWAF